MASWKLITTAFIAILPAALAAQEDLAKEIVNDPAAPEVSGAKATLVDDARVQGGKALRIAVPRKGTNPWDSAVGGVLKKPVQRGDHLVLLFSARLEKGENGATTTTLPYAAIQLAAAPYSTIMRDSAGIGPDWKDFKVDGVADNNYSPNQLKVTVQLATAKQTVDFGPIVVLDRGK